MKIPVVELSECTLCGVCEEVAPLVFRVTDAGYIEVIELSSYPEIEVEEAIKCCPEDCIYWEEAKSSGLVDGVCKACSNKMGALDSAQDQGLTLLDEMTGHPSMARYRDNGYEIVSF